MPEEPTAPDLVERTRASIRGAGQGELESSLSDLASDAVWEVGEQGIRLRGAASIRSFLQEWASSVEDWRFEAEEICEIGQGVTLVVYRQFGQAPGSTFSIEDRGAQVYEWSGGSIVRISHYSNTDEGRTAAEALAESSG